MVRKKKRKGKKTRKRKTSRRTIKKSKKVKGRVIKKGKPRKKHVSIKVAKKVKRKIKQPYPRKFLRSVSPENSLWIINGNIVKSLRELLKQLKRMNDDVFRYHVNKDRNDFYKWVKEIIGDFPLARGVKKAKNRHRVIKLIKQRIKG